MKKLFVLSLLMSFMIPAVAQEKRVVVQTCGSPPATYSPGTPQPATMDTNGNDCANTSGSGGSTTVIGNVGGFDSGSSPVQFATPANSSHAAGVSVGGLFSVPIARTNGGSGGVGNLLFTSSGGSVGSYVVRMWDKNPAATTCTDNSAFAGSNTDNQHLIADPFTITPSAPAVTTGDTNTYTQTSFVPPLSFLNQDTSISKNIYICVVTVATDTADENKPVYVTATGYQN